MDDLRDAHLHRRDGISSNLHYNAARTRRVRALDDCNQRDDRNGHLVEIGIHFFSRRGEAMILKARCNCRSNIGQTGKRAQASCSFNRNDQAKKSNRSQRMVFTIVAERAA